MKIISSLVHTVLFVANLAAAAGFLLCAYSPYISPVRHPVWACAGLFFPLFMGLNAVLFVAWICLRSWIALFPLAVFALGWDSLRTYFPLNLTQSPERKTIKVLTYNTQGLAAAEGTEGGHSVLEYLRDSNADILCMQEFRTGSHATQQQVDEALKTYPYHEVTRFEGGNVVACYSRYPILSAERIRYTSHFNGSMLYRLEIDGDTVMVINNHLESNKLDNEDKRMYKSLLKSPDETKVKTEGKHLLLKLAEASAIRAPQADSVAQAIVRNHTRYMVVCGDFNDSPVSYAHRVIGKGLHDAFVEAGVGPGFTYNQNRLYFRIDHIFASPAFRVCECKVDRNIRASDHYPVWCILEFKK